MHCTTPFINKNVNTKIFCDKKEVYFSKSHLCSGIKNISGLELSYKFLNDRVYELLAALIDEKHFRSAVKRFSLYKDFTIKVSKIATEREYGFQILYTLTSKHFDVRMFLDFENYRLKSIRTNLICNSKGRLIKMIGSDFLVSHLEEYIGDNKEAAYRFEFNWISVFDHQHLDDYRKPSYALMKEYFRNLQESEIYNCYVDPSISVYESIQHPISVS